MVVGRVPVGVADYERIFRVAYSVLQSVEARTPRACIFFSMVGAAILAKFYKKRAMLVAGAAFYRVDDTTNTVMAMGSVMDGVPSSSKAAFHCWLQCEGYAIDFMAPIFGETFALDGHAISFSARMFQKPLVKMSATPASLEREGDFYLQPNVGLTQELFNPSNRKIAEYDLVDVCLYWYRRPPKQIEPKIEMTDDLGDRTTIQMSGPRLAGIW